jgi:hypothetical protein
MTQFETGDTLHYDFDARQITHTRDGKALSCVPLHQPSGARYTASTPAEFERELSAEGRAGRDSLSEWPGTFTECSTAIPVGDAQEVDFDAGTKFYGPLGGMKPGRTFRASEGWEAPRVDPMCAAMSQPRFGMFPPGTKASVIRWPDLDDAPAKRCLADDLATRDFFERGPAPAEVPERAPERAKPPLAGFDVAHEGRWHLS